MINGKFVSENGFGWVSGVVELHSSVNETNNDALVVPNSSSLKPFSSVSSFIEPINQPSNTDCHVVTNSDGRPLNLICNDKGLGQSPEILIGITFICFVAFIRHKISYLWVSN